MKNSLLAFSFIALLIVACKKEKPNVIPQPDPAPALTWKLNKTWTMSGYRVTHYFPSQGAPSTTRTDINNSSGFISVINDSTILFRDSLVLFETNTAEGYMEFIPPIFKSIGQRYEPTNLKYYYNKDSVTYLERTSGHAFMDSTVLHTL